MDPLGPIIRLTSMKSYDTLKIRLYFTQYKILITTILYNCAKRNKICKQKKLFLKMVSKFQILAMAIMESFILTSNFGENLISNA